MERDIDKDLELCAKAKPGEFLPLGVANEFISMAGESLPYYINDVKRLQDRLVISPYGDDKIDELEEAMEHLRAREDRLRAENQRMREALEKISEYRIYALGNSREMEGYSMAPNCIRDIAKKALEVRMSSRKCLSCAYFDRTVELSCMHCDRFHCAGSPKRPMYLKRKTPEEKLSPSLRKILNQNKQ